MRIVPIPCLSDNYAYLVVCEATNEAAIVDPSESEPVAAAINAEGVKLRAIWATHHHVDHVGGNDAIAAQFGIEEVTGHASDRGRIPGQSRFLETGDTFKLGELEVSVFHIPGHTLGAIAYEVHDRAREKAPAVFTGDTLFVGGCGRIFEGTPEQMHTSLQRIAQLPGETAVYCGHEYTEANLRFAAHVEPTNRRVTAAQEHAAKLRAEKKPTVPGTLAEELATNPFLRTDSPELRQTLGIPNSASPSEALATIRAAKNKF